MPSNLQRTLAGVAFAPELTARKLVLIAGPRQAGKTTLVRDWLAGRGCASLYFNWDDPRVRRAWRQDPHFFEAAARATAARPPWIALDEIHKATGWRNLLKGWYDVFGREFRFVVTGSARLDLLRRAGDSLVGRHFLFHLFPLGVGARSARRGAAGEPRGLGALAGLPFVDRRRPGEVRAALSAHA